MQHGGKRQGAGRKSDAAKERLTAQAAARVAGIKDTAAISNVADLATALQNAQEGLVRAIVERQDELVTAMIDLAVGATLQDADKEGNTVTYTQLPDRQAISWLMEMAHGKATQRREVKQDTTINIISQVPRPTFAALPAHLTEGEAEEPIDVLLIAGSVPALPATAGSTPGTDDPFAED